MLLSGVDPRTASEIAGHSRPDTTTRIYTHSNLEVAIAAIERLDNPFGGMCPQKAKGSQNATP